MMFEILGAFEETLGKILNGSRGTDHAWLGALAFGSSPDVNLHARVEAGIGR